MYKIMSNNLTDTKAIEQIEGIAKVFDKEKIVIMPDYHAGKGCVVGTTMVIKDRVCPNYIGVDIGCLDNQTEILTKNGWVKISEYNNTEILVYNKETDTAYFDLPINYIKAPCDSFYHLKTDGGLDQVISKEHKILAWIGTKKQGYKLKDIIAEDFVNKHNSLSKGISGGIKTTFKFNNKPLNISNEILRVIVMISADGTIRVNKDKSTRIELHFKKERKINRANQLLKEAKIDYKMTKLKDGTTNFYFKGQDVFTKNLSFLWNASYEQLDIVANECLFWDGTIIKNKNSFNYSTTIKDNADIIQFAYAVNNKRCGIHEVEYKNNNWNKTYNVYGTKNEIVGFPERRKINTIKSTDGFKYCFTTSTGYFIIRRNNKISITGNCGVLAYKIDKKQITFDENKLKELDNIIRNLIPNGKNVHESIMDIGNIGTIEDILNQLYVELDYEARERAMLSVGTLGGGNHFIELGESKDYYYLFVHTGSRNLGVKVASYYQNLAGKICNYKLNQRITDMIQYVPKESRQQFIENYRKNNPFLPKEHCYLTGKEMNYYLHDMRLVQKYADCNRKRILDVILNHLDIYPRQSCNYIQSTHNYIDGNNILRKGSISAQKGENVIIPMNMRDGVIIGKGKGNPEWNYSAPHGAGRILSRTDAMNKLSLDEFKETMKGVYTTCVSYATLDESPMAYKPMEEILDVIGDTIEIDEIVKPIYNFKASE